MSHLKDLIWKKACRGRRCCPQFAIEQNKVHIRDDHGGQVVLTNNELHDLIDAINEIREIPGNEEVLTREDGDC